MFTFAQTLSTSENNQVKPAVKDYVNVIYIQTSISNWIIGYIYIQLYIRIQ